jgi:RimJ/RimL family protein N-acetyltransferase
LYTLVQEDRLLYYGWLVDRQERSEDPQMGQVFFPPSHSSVIFDCFVHPVARGQGLYQRALLLMMEDARDIAAAAQVCMGAFADNVISRHVLDKLGFHHIGSMILMRRFGLRCRSAVALAPEFRTERL